MTKVQELLKNIDETLDAVAKEINPCFTRDYFGLTDSIFELISAARFEGFTEGCDDLTMNLDLVTEAEAYARGKRDGIEETLQRVRESAHPLMVGMDGSPEVFTVRASVFAPDAKEEK